MPTRIDAKRERRNFWFFGLGLFVSVAIAILIPDPTPSQQSGLRWFAAIMAAGVGYNIPGFLSVNWRLRIGTVDIGIKAAGALAIFVVVFLVNPPILGETATMTIRASAADQPKITTGKVTVQVEDYSRAKEFDQDGEATFRDVPKKYTGKNMRVLPEVPGYAQEWVSTKVGSTVSISLNPPQTHIEGRIILAFGMKATDLRIFADENEGTIDEAGRFNVPLHSTGTVDLKVYRGDKIVYDRNHLIPGPVTIPLKHSR